MNITLLKKMSREVSVKSLGGLLVDYAQVLVEKDAADPDAILAIDVILTELKSRSGVGQTQKRKPRRPKTQASESASQNTIVATIGGNSN